MTVDSLLRSFQQLFSAAGRLLGSLIALLRSEMPPRLAPARSRDADARHVRDFRRGPNHGRGE